MQMIAWCRVKVVDCILCTPLSWRGVPAGTCWTWRGRGEICRSTTKASSPTPPWSSSLWIGNGSGTRYWAAKHRNTMALMAQEHKIYCQAYNCSGIRVGPKDDDSRRLLIPDERFAELCHQFQQIEELKSLKYVKSLVELLLIWEWWLCCWMGRISTTNSNN